MDLWPIIFTISVPVMHAVGLAHAAHALLNVRTSQGTVAWVVSLCSFPYLAVPLYWVLGRNRFHGYVLARRSDEAAVAKTFASAGSDITMEWGVPSAETHGLSALERLAALPVTRGNDAELLINGQVVYERMFEAIAAATRHVLVEFYIVKDDRIGSRFAELLAQKASEGVRVWFIYDEVGSLSFPSRRIRELKEAGVNVRAFGSLTGRFQINFRNHRKIVVVDGCTAFLGGLNIGDEYAGQTGRFGRWRDTHLRLDGPAALCVQMAFLEDWQSASEGDQPNLDWDCGRKPDGTNEGKRVLIVPTGPADVFESGLLMFVSAINRARERLWIASPYFVPDEAIVAALQSAALRGVDVRILLPENPDQFFVYLSSFAYFADMDRAGIRIYRYREGFMHQKVMLIDSEIAAVGTANLDNRSARLNFEITAFVNDTDFASDVARMLKTDFAASQRVDAADYRRQSWWFRAAVRVARVFAPLQ